jgi:ankyrin repeat protein
LTLHTAAATGDAESVMHSLISNDVDSVDFSGRTALHCAAAAGQASIVRLLLAAGASREVCVVSLSFRHVARFSFGSVLASQVRDVDGDTALHAAALSGSVATASHLLDAGADANVTCV